MSVGPADLDAMLGRAVAGDTAALISLLEACAPKVRARIEPRIGPHLRSALDVDDVMQVTYIEAVSRIGRFSTGGVSGFLAWLTRMAENNLIDAIRSLEAARRPDPSRRVGAARSTAESMVALIDVLSGSMTTPTHAAARGEAAGALEVAIKGLPPDYEKVIRLYDLEGRPIEEVAAAVNRTSGAVFMLRARALDRLRDAMGSSGRFFSQQA